MCSRFISLNEKPLKLVPVQHLHLPCLLGRQLTADGRVSADESLLHGLFQRGAAGGMTHTHHPVGQSLAEVFREGLPAILFESCVKLLEIILGQLVQRDVANLRDDVQADATLIAQLGGGADLGLGVGLIPALQPIPEAHIGLHLIGLDAAQFLFQFLKFFGALPFGFGEDILRLRIRKGGKKSQDTPCKWCKTTVTKILTLREYTGTLINFKTYSKSFKNKHRLDNPEENWAIFENHHEAIIDTATWEQVQKLREGTKRRKPKNSEKNMFAGLLYCADCGHKLHYNINHPNSSIEYFNCSNYRGNRGTCDKTHYIRADSLEQVVLLELKRMVCYLKDHEEEFADLLAKKTTKDYEQESRNRRQRLQELIARNKEVDRLFERIYEDNVAGKLTDERFMKMSQRYDEEQQQLKKEIEELQRRCDKEDDRVFCKDQFLKAVRKFMEMKTLTPTILHELVERIDVYQTQGTGKNRTQRIVIHYNFIGVLDLPEVEEYPDNVVLDSRQGVAIEYLVGKAG